MGASQYEGIGVSIPSSLLFQQPARISRWSAARERTKKRSEWSSDMRTDATDRGYRSPRVTSISADGTGFLIGTGRFFEQSPGANLGEILRQLDKMMREVGLK